MAKKKKADTKTDQDIFADIDEEAKKSVTEADLEGLSALAERQKVFEAGPDEKIVASLFKSLIERGVSLATISAVQTKVNQVYQQVRMTELPEKMEELGFSSFTLKSGGSIEVKDGLSVTVKDKEALKEALIRAGYQDAIKNQVVVLFPMEGRKSSKRFVKYVNRYYADRDKCTLKEKEDVHAQTLKKLMGEFKEKGKQYPDSVSVFEYKYTKIK